MRNRMVSKEITTSESLGCVSQGAVLCFILLLMYADDTGLMMGRFSTIRNVIYASRDDVTVGDLRGYMAELDEVGCIEVMCKDGHCVISIPHFKEYQTISRPTPSKIDATGARSADIDEFDDRGNVYDGVWNA